MRSDGRQKTAKKSESASDQWRRIEQSGLENALRKLAASKTELAVISGISSDDAASISRVMVELRELLSTIRVSYVENEKDIFDGDEKEKRFLTASCPTIIEIWSEYSTFAANYAVAFVQKGWLNSSEHRALLSDVMEVVGASVQLLVLAVNMAAYHSLEDAGGVNKMAVNETARVCSDLEEYVIKVDSLGASHPAVGRLSEITGWQLYGLSHLINKVIKVGMEARGPDDSFDDHMQLVDSVSSLTEKLQGKWGQESRAPSNKPQTPPPPAPVQEDKKSSKKNKKGDQTVESKETKKDSPPPPKDDTKQQEYLQQLQIVPEIYQQYSDDAWEKKRLPELRGSSGVVLRYRAHTYEVLGKLKVDACPMAHRKSHLDSLHLSDFHCLHSDIYSITPDGLSCNEEVTIEFPLMPWTVGEGQTVGLKVKVDGQWTDADNAEIITSGETPHVMFNTNRCEAFTALSYNKPDTLTVGPAGANYVSAANGKVELAVPADCFSQETSLAIKTHEFNKRNYDDMFVGVVSASVALEVTPDDGSDVTMNKSISIQLPIPDDQDDKDTELVVVRSNSSTVQVLDKKQLAVKTIDRGLFALDMKGFWCVAVLRIKRIFLNMRESIKKEYYVGYKKKHPCNIVTYIDDVTRGDETQTFFMELIEKCQVESSVEARRQEGKFEVRKSRSKDVLVHRGDEVMMAVDGQIRCTEALTENEKTLCFLRGGNNVVIMATEIKRDPEKMPDAMICYKQMPGDTVLHSMAIMTRDLSELPTEQVTARTGMNIDADAKRDKMREESAEQLLKMESLMALARELTAEEGAALGHVLGIKDDRLKAIKEANDKDIVSANFGTLCEWRGRFARSAMADFLVSSLKTIGKVSYAELIIDVRKNNRALEKADFERTRPIRRTKTTI